MASDTHEMHPCNLVDTVGWGHSDVLPVTLTLTRSQARLQFWEDRGNLASVRVGLTLRGYLPMVQTIRKEQHVFWDKLLQADGSDD